MNKVTRIIGAALLAVALGAGAAGCGGSPKPAPSPTPLADDDCDVSAGTPALFGAGTATNLAGVVYGTGKTGVVLAHQSDGSLCQWSPYAQILGKRGYRALAFDFPSYGSSHGSDALDAAVVEAARYLREHGATSVVLIGASMGGTAVVAAAPQISPPPAAVVSLSGPSNYSGVSAYNAAPQLTMPVLYAVCQYDTAFVDSAHELYDRTPATVKRQLLEPNCGGHGVDLMFDSATKVVVDAVDALLAGH
jgi:pimeloyl-ACP methyl ester carboxylesterase